MSKKSKNKKLLVITGPTATGKTDVALKLAKKFNGELVSIDSRQVYIGLDIGTGKLPSKGDQVKIKKGIGFWEINDIKIWAYDLVTVQKQYTVADYIEDAKKYITDIIARDKLPILVGGTYFYIKSLLDGLPNLSIPTDPNFRARLDNYSLTELQQELKKLSPQKWQELNESDQQNSRRLLRALELIYMNPHTDNNKKWVGLKNNFDILKIGLTTSREILYKKSDSRVLDWFELEIEYEVQNLMENGVSVERFTELGLEYKAIAKSLASQENDRTLLISSIQNLLHGYIRRQLTWFKKDADIKWFNITQKNFLGEIEKYITKWYDSKVKLSKKKYAKKN